MKKTRNIFLITCLISTIITCNKKYDEPPTNDFPNGTYITISDLKSTYTSTATTIDSNFIITGIITTEETNGNFYKETFIQDNSGGIKLELKNAGGLYIGDSIKISLQGLILSDYGDMIQIEEVDTDKNVLKIATKRHVSAYLVNINNLNMIDDPCKLIALENVEFSNVNSTYSDGINLSTGENEITDCSGNIITLRTSGYANFADDSVDRGNGTIIGVFTKYGTEKQLVLRDINEVQLDSTRCDGTGGGGTGGGGQWGVGVIKDFSDGSITSGGWKNFWSGTNPNIGEWEIYTTFGSNGDVAKASNYSNSTNYACESWLVSPLVDLSSTSSPYLVFDNVTRYSGDALELFISADYDGVSDPDMSGTWINITSYVPNWDTDDFTWDLVSSGNTDLTPFISSSVAIAFKYTGSNNSGATWEVDNILITE